MKVTKRRKVINSKIDLKKEYSINEAVTKLKETSKTKFNESVDIAMRLGVDPKG
jgi:large subunit ribosomal protein L1